MLRRTRRFRLPPLAILLLALPVLVAGCAAVFDVSDYGFDQPVSNRTVASTQFNHRVISKPGQGNQLHVYIEGDGRPWETRISPAQDPTPTRALTLELMALDPAPALFLGRPCYFVRRDAPCADDRWWTSHRYGREVVESLDTVLDRYAPDYSGVVLIGHSGGGTLAYLLAARRDDVEALVTLGANLDHTLWARDHRYAPLYGSLQPAKMPPLPASLRQLHYLGVLDRNVSAAMISNVIADSPSASLERVTAVDHSCCWPRVWPQVLRTLEDAQ